MKRFAAICGLGLAAFCQSQMRAQEKTSSAPVTVTGCISQGDEPNEYAIKDSTGKTYGLVRSRVNLKSHVGHTVTVTGTEVKENEGKEQKEHAKSGKAEESEHLQVTNLKMVSTSCQ